jgi:predicted  nucleic acid-binding Zn-ribbon protein
MNENTDSGSNDSTDEVDETLDALSDRVETLRERIEPPETEGSGGSGSDAGAEVTSADEGRSQQATADEPAEVEENTGPESEADPAAPSAGPNTVDDPEVTDPTQPPVAEESAAADDAADALPDAGDRESPDAQQHSGSDETGHRESVQAESMDAQQYPQASGASQEQEAPVDTDDPGVSSEQQADPENGPASEPTDGTDDSVEPSGASTAPASPTGEDSSPISEDASDIEADELYTLLSTIERFIQTIRLFKTQLESVETRIDSQRDDVELLEDTSVDVMNQLTEIIDVIDTQHERLLAVESELAEYGETLSERGHEVETLREEVTDNRSNISSVRSNNLGLREELAEAKDDLFDSKQRIEQVHKRTREIDDEITSLDNEDSRLQSEIDELRETNQSLSDEVSSIESGVRSLENRTVEIGDEDLLLRAALRKLNRQMLSEDDVRSIAAEESESQVSEMKQQLSTVQSALEKLISTGTKRADIVGEIESLRSDVRALKGDQEQVQPGDSAGRQNGQGMETNQSGLRSSVRELERENRAIKELIEGIEDENTN